MAREGCRNVVGDIWIDGCRNKIQWRGGWGWEWMTRLADVLSVRRGGGGRQMSNNEVGITANLTWSPQAARGQINSHPWLGVVLGFLGNPIIGLLLFSCLLCKNPPLISSFWQKILLEGILNGKNSLEKFSVEKILSGKNPHRKETSLIKTSFVNLNSQGHCKKNLYPIRRN